MASYLETATIGEFDIKAYRADGIKFLDAIDPDLLKAPPAAHRQAVRDLADRRAVLQTPLAGDQRARPRSPLSFWIQRDTEPNWDHFFVEAHTVGADDWTTLPDSNT